MKGCIIASVACCTTRIAAPTKNMGPINVRNPIPTLCMPAPNFEKPVPMPVIELRILPPCFLNV